MEQTSSPLPAATIEAATHCTAVSGATKQGDNLGQPPRSAQTPYSVAFGVGRGRAIVARGVARCVGRGPVFVARKRVAATYTGGQAPRRLQADVEKLREYV